MQMTGGEILIKTLVDLGVEVMWGMPGGVVLPLYDHFIKYPQLKHILVRHEQGGAFAADGYARITGRVGVCLGTSGPGSTNLVTGIAGAYMDSVPMLAITGQVASPLIGSDAFQEVDSIGITVPIVKHSFLAQRAEEVADMITTAYYLAGSGRPGPVHVDVTKDALMTPVEWVPGRIMDLPGYRIPRMIESGMREVNKQFEALLAAPGARPIVIAGHGVELGRAEEELLAFAEKLNLPVANTLLGTGTFPQGHRQWLGPVGMHGTALANKTLAESNLVIGIGMRWDDRVTGSLDSFRKGKTFVHFEIDDSEIGKIVTPAVAFIGDAKETLRESVKSVKSIKFTAWWEEIEGWRKLWPPLDIPSPQQDSAPISQAWAISQLSSITGGEDIVASDVGRHQMWVMRYYRFQHPNSHASHGGLGAMGYGVPAAMGARAGAPERRVWAVTGDGSFQINIQELATIAENKVPLKIVLMNDFSLGMVRQWQELFYKSNLAASTFSGNPDFAKVAEAYGIPARRVKKPADLAAAYRWAMDTDGPTLIDVWVDQNEHVYPMVPAGKGVHEQIVIDPRRDQRKLSPSMFTASTSD